ncbi:MAG: NADPH-dependent 7-cyano-7-deazaguanine reductase QueF, partial [Gammaproteobacteria bacterium]
ELGKKSAYDVSYNPDKLFPIPRSGKRKEIGIDPDNLPFYGVDIWNHYEVSWINSKGKPIVAIAEIYYDCHSPNIVESKSLKLYFNSFNNTTFADVSTVEKTVAKDLAERVGADVFVKITPLDRIKNETLYHAMDGVCLDDLDISCTTYSVDPSSLTVESKTVTETVYSDLLKSNCLVTNQPDWGSVQISYKGKQINHTGLLQYIVSFRNHNEFHEQCIERIFADIMKYCEPKELTVYGRYTRRGGLDINPYRSTNKVDIKGKNQRLCRQ